MENIEYPHPQSISEPTKKAWYLFGEAGASGPFSELEVIQQINQRKVDASYKAWSPALGKWEKIFSVTEFRPYENKAAEQPQLEINSEKKVAPLTDEDWDRILGQSRFTFDDAEGGKAISFRNRISDLILPLKKSPMSSRYTRAFLVGIFASVTVAWIFNHYSILNSMTLDSQDISAQEFREIKAAVSEPFSAGDPSVAIGLIKNVDNGVSFAIGSNQSDGTRFLVKIEGISETLIGAFEFSSQSSVSLKNGIARTSNLLVDSKQKIPAGEYRISVLCESCEKAHVLTEKIYFINGSRNLEYDLKLRQYHKDLRQQGRNELLEAEQLTETLEREVMSLSAVLAGGAEGSPGRKTLPDTFGRMHQQLGNIISQWSKKNSRKEVFYGSVFSSLQQAFEVTSQTQELQKKYLMNLNSHPAVASELEEEIVLKNSNALSSLVNLKHKIKNFERLPLSANGMPRNK